MKKIIIVLLIISTILLASCGTTRETDTGEITIIIKQDGKTITATQQARMADIRQLQSGLEVPIGCDFLIDLHDPIFTSQGLNPDGAIQELTIISDFAITNTGNVPIKVTGTSAEMKSFYLGGS